MRLPIKKQSVVPRYQNIEKVGGFCNFLFKLPNIGGSLLGVDVSFRSFLCAKENGHITIGRGLGEGGCLLVRSLRQRE
jgi:hypothetical protein